MPRKDAGMHARSPHRETTAEMTVEKKETQKKEVSSVTGYLVRSVGGGDRWEREDLAGVRRRTRVSGSGNSCVWQRGTLCDSAVCGGGRRRGGDESAAAASGAAAAAASGAATRPHHGAPGE
eukprot:2974417-Prymnesium_polylepis.1